MNADARTQALEALIASFERLLSSLESDAFEGADALAHAWSRCDDAFEELRAQNEALADRATSTEFRARLDHARKLQTMAMSLAQRESDAASEDLARLSGLARRLKRLDAPPTLGESCDVRA